MKRTLASEISFAQNAITNALNHAEISKRLAEHRFDRKKLLEGKSITENVRMLHLSKQDKYGIQYACTDTFKADQMQAKKQYSRHIKIARLAFEGDRGIEETLQISGKRKTDIDGWLAQAHAFYNKIGAYSKELSRYSISPEELSQTKAMIEALYDKRQQQLISKGDAQHATRQREEARNSLKVWISRFRKTARLALQDEPQLLEALGILVKTQKV